MTPADIERAAQALAEHRDAGGIPWADKILDIQSAARDIYVTMIAASPYAPKETGHESD